MRHGGNISAARARYGEPDGGWLDLSTGINPVPYPFTMPSAEAWMRLPQHQAEVELLEAARGAYGVAAGADLVAAPGTQLLIQLAARLRADARVAVVGPTYSEHAIAWRDEGSDVVEIGEPEEALSSSCSVLVVVNPNNPDGRTWSPSALRVIAAELSSRGGFVVIDEAFADAQTHLSLASTENTRGLIVLRSFGKFYGLGGLRLGFALGDPAEIARLRRCLGPWAVSGPAIEIGRQALLDTNWAEEARARLAADEARLAKLLEHTGFEIVGTARLFVLARHPNAQRVAHELARQGILVRTFDYSETWIRLGLPGPASFDRLEAVLRSIA